MINQELYDNLMTLCNTNEAFFFKDFPISTGGCYRIFNYRLATYTDFMLPSALECRGIMFELDKDGNALRVASRPMEKFFNAGENPYTMDLDYSDVEKIMIKEDGSLISTYIDFDGRLALKTKGSLTSEQAVDATRWLKDGREMSFALEKLARNGWTVNLEWVAPHNRIVLQYTTPALVVLNVRCNATGVYMSECNYPSEFFPYTVNGWAPKDLITAEELVEYVHSLEGFEGVVVKLREGKHVKIKTKWYSVLHAAKDSVDNPKALIATVLAEGLDDLKALFSDNPDAIARMEKYELIVSHAFNHVMHKLGEFHKKWNGESRKDYAIAAKEYWAEESQFFGVQMNMFVRPDVSIEQGVKDNIMKYWKLYVLPADMKLVIDAEE